MIENLIKKASPFVLLGAMIASSGCSETPLTLTGRPREYYTPFMASSRVLKEDTPAGWKAFYESLKPVRGQYVLAKDEETIYQYARMEGKEGVKETLEEHPEIEKWGIPINKSNPTPQDMLFAEYYRAYHIKAKSK